MGVPAFFRWLSKKYPSILVHTKKDSPPEEQYYFDNLYLDMNGIIHPCSHPENKPPPANEEEMFLAIFEYVEDIMRIVKPQKVLYMAIDGVAPRAKMNQQRSRRFRAAQESKELREEISRVKERLRDEGHVVKEKEKEAHFDSNVITPGTDFMLNLSEALRSWVNRRLSPEFEDKHGIWPKDMVVILSDASSPGEGEHKIMEFIRKQKAAEDYNPAVSHCLYGADADLIMLGLATHEPNFTILREEFKPNQPRPCELCGQIGHVLKECTGEEAPPDQKPLFGDTDFLFIRLNVLREYLERESQSCKVKLNFERFIDDWIFMCFFVGNDFLPHLPSLEIRENAIDRLISLYKAVMETSSNVEEDYLTNNGFVNKERAQLVLLALGDAEDDIFKNRKIDEDQFRERNKKNKIRKLNEELRWFQPEKIGQYGKRPFNPMEEARKVRAYNHAQDQNQAAAQKLKSMLVGGESSEPSADQEPEETEKERKARLKQEELQNKINRIRNDEDPDFKEPEDNVKLFVDGWKERYYKLKFGDEVENRGGDVDAFGRHVADEYFKGLCWVLLYYYQGCPDWKWYYPFHYAPFASDFGDCVQMDTTFDGEAQPFFPLEQLMSVFPAASSKNLPPTWRKLMTEPDSPILHFYPEHFVIDLNGKRAAWMGVALLPFINEKELFDCLKNVYQDLTEHEKLRNTRGEPLIFVSKSHSKLAGVFEDLLKAGSKVEIPKGDELQFKILAGSVKTSDRFSEVYTNIICCEFYDPEYPKGFVFPARLLPNAKMPDKALKPEDFASFDQYRPQIGMNPRNNRGARLDASAHRMINRDVRHNQYGYDVHSGYKQNNSGGYQQRGGHQGNQGNHQGHQGHHNDRQQNRHHPYSRPNDGYQQQQQGGRYQNQGQGGYSHSNYNQQYRQPTYDAGHRHNPNQTYQSAQQRPNYAGRRDYPPPPQQQQQYPQQGSNPYAYNNAYSQNNYSQGGGGQGGYGQHQQQQQGGRYGDRQQNNGQYSGQNRYNNQNQRRYN